MRRVHSGKTPSVATLAEVWNGELPLIRGHVVALESAAGHPIFSGPLEHSLKAVPVLWGDLPVRPDDDAQEGLPVELLSGLRPLPVRMDLHYDVRAASLDDDVLGEVQAAHVDVALPLDPAVVPASNP